MLLDVTEFGVIIRPLIGEIQGIVGCMDTPQDLLVCAILGEGQTRLRCPPGRSKEFKGRMCTESQRN